MATKDSARVVSASGIHGVYEGRRWTKPAMAVVHSAAVGAVCWGLWALCPDGHPARRAGLAAAAVL